MDTNVKPAKEVVFVVLAIPVFLALISSAIAGSSLYFYRLAIARSDKSFLGASPDLAANASARADRGSDRHTDLHDNDWWENQTIADWRISSDDGLQLSAYFIKAAGLPGKTAILAHGYSGDAKQMIQLAQMYIDAFGYNVLLPDARGHGRSDGRYIGFGWHERLDYIKWIDQVIAHIGPHAQIVLHGISMGGATVLMASGEELPANVKAIVADCGYTSVKDQLAYQLKRLYRMPSFPMIPFTSLMTRMRAGYFFGEASALAQVRKSRTPTLFIHGEADTFVPTWMVRELYENGPPDKSLYLVPKAGHGLAQHVDPTRYEQEVGKFIGQYVH
ncbi:alpha/beta hydrolase [Cohnella soli]|uniref:Alpha/beta hydrolase n=1 Tax=Cohnella soli TaxID=425005 RepID=A0ABW0HRX0_9BACL